MPVIRMLRHKCSWLVTRQWVKLRRLLGQRIHQLVQAWPSKVQLVSRVRRLASHTTTVPWVAVATAMWSTWVLTVGRHTVRCRRLWRQIVCTTTRIRRILMPIRKCLRSLMWLTINQPTWWLVATRKLAVAWHLIQLPVWRVAVCHSPRQIQHWHWVVIRTRSRHQMALSLTRCQRLSQDHKACMTIQRMLGLRMPRRRPLRWCMQQLHKRLKWLLVKPAIFTQVRCWLRSLVILARLWD